MENPFKPTAGKTPPELIGREEVLDEFVEGLDNGAGAPGRLMRITGVRGMGKTVMLNELGKRASSRGWDVVHETASGLFTERILQTLTPRVLVRGATVQPQVFGFELGALELERRAVSLREAMDKSARGHAGLLVTLDEVQDASLDEMRTLATVVQHLIRDDRDVAFVFAGLPSMVEGVVNADSLTFLRRAVSFTLGPLASFEVADSMGETIRGAGLRVADQVVDRLASAAAGYPFMVQLVGYYAWQAASRRGLGEMAPADAEKGIATALRRFEAMVVEPALHRLPPMQVRYLLAMAFDGEEPSSTSAVAGRMGLSTRDVSVYRDRLMKAGVIDGSAWGRVRFAIPYMGDYLRAHADEIEGEIADVGSGMAD